MRRPEKKAEGEAAVPEERGSKKPEPVKERLREQAKKSAGTSRVSAQVNPVSWNLF
jgi:hypothetical protein